MKSIVSSLLFLVSFISLSVSSATVSQGEIPYYGREFYQELKSGLTNKDLLSRLNVILKSVHAANENEYDTIAADCQGQICYQHTALGYDRARKYMMGEMYLTKTEKGYELRDVYCAKNVGPEDYPHGDEPRPQEIPDGNIVNTEHTWPQSKFSHNYPAELQKSDLHHLFPPDNKLNAIRGNFPFGDVKPETPELKCGHARFGESTLGEPKVFEPPKGHKGNVARALFYFATRYELSIDPHQEETLKRWNHEDPVTDEDRAFNDRIFQLQGDRNPFVDFPELADKVADF